ncbi:MAG: DUF4394 domain-containing protein [bacterium]
MKSIQQQFIPALALAVVCLFASACDQNTIITVPGVVGRPLYGVDINGNLLRFGSMNPGVIANSYTINGLQIGESILGIDFRPLDRRLFALGSMSRIYVIDTLSGAAIQVGPTPFTPLIAGNSFGFDFNPVPDRIRLHSNSGQDLRLNPDTGALAGTDSMLAYTLGDINAGILPNVSGTAYTNSRPGAITTTLYAIDSNLDVLTTLPTPNNGQMSTLGTIGVNTSDLLGFDIAGSDSMAYAAFFIGDPSGLSGLYTINLVTGAATMVGLIGTPGANAPLRALTIAP